MGATTGTVRAFVPKSRNVQGVYQLSATLASDRIADVNERFNEARRLALQWMNRRMKRELSRSVPKPAWDGERFEIDQHGQLYGGMTLPDLDLWTCRMEHDDSAVAARTWSVDLALRRVGKEVILIQRTLCTSPVSCLEPVPLTVPRIVLDLVNGPGLKDVVPISGKPWLLNSAGDLDLLHLLLADSGRLLPVVMLTEADEIATDRTYKVRRFVLEPSALAKDLTALAHVVVMPHELGFEWTRRVGKPWTAFNGAVRTFRPGLNFESDDPYRHPLAKLDDIVLWEYNGVLSPQKLLGEDAFHAFLKEKAFQTLSSRQLRHEDTLFYRYAKIRSLANETSNRTATSAVEQELRLEIAELRKQIDEERNEKDYVYSYSAELEESAQRLERERFNLRTQLELLRSGLGQAARVQIPIPNSFGEIEDWQQHVAGQLWIAPRAISAASKSQYKEPSLVYEALLLLANEYRQMRIHGGDEYRESYEDGLKRLKLNQARSIAESRVGEQGDEYYVNHPFQPGKKVFLEEHLRRGNDRDQRNTLRIYFAWEQQEQVVIVGWLPGHLTTRNS